MGLNRVGEVGESTSERYAVWEYGAGFTMDWLAGVGARSRLRTKGSSDR